MLTLLATVLFIVLVTVAVALPPDRPLRLAMASASFVMGGVIQYGLV